MKNKYCPYCKSKNIQKVVIKFSNSQEQRVGLCMSCKKIFSIKKGK